MSALTNTGQGSDEPGSKVPAQRRPATQDDLMHTDALTTLSEQLRDLASANANATGVVIVPCDPQGDGVAVVRCATPDIEQADRQAATLTADLSQHRLMPRVIVAGFESGVTPFDRSQVLRAAIAHIELGGLSWAAFSEVSRISRDWRTYSAFVDALEARGARLALPHLPVPDLTGAGALDPQHPRRMASRVRRNHRT